MGCAVEVTNPQAARRARGVTVGVTGREAGVCNPGGKEANGAEAEGEEEGQGYPESGHGPGGWSAGGTHPATDI